MDGQQSPHSSHAVSGHTRDKRLGDLSRRILAGANRGLSRNTFFKTILQLLIDFSGCDAVELRVIDHDKLQCCEFNALAGKKFLLKLVTPKCDRTGRPIPCLNMNNDRERVCWAVAEGKLDRTLPYVTAHGSFWTADTGAGIRLESTGPDLHINGDFRSLAVIPFAFENKYRGMLILKGWPPDFPTAAEVEFFEEIAHLLGIAVAHWQAQIALGERIKELTCLCGMAKISARPNISLPEILRETVELLPGAWQFPDIAAARIMYDGAYYATPRFRDGLQCLQADIDINGERHGSIEVAYVRKVREYDEGPFLKEERNLIEALAREVGLLIERKTADEEKHRLEEQLLHADRLATIGQMAAGVAHELNEPLGSILGFAQLVSKNPEKSETVNKDIEKIIAAALHARTVIERLNLFARQSPQKKGPVDINRVINDGLYFLESRCIKAGIEMTRVLEPNIPELIADNGQLYQVLVNLVVNAIQAMPGGGRLTIRTGRGQKDVRFSVEDTGVGMDAETRKKIFMPFFTTKDVNEGTGLGLAVVHGIVTSHGGTIQVESTVGKGSKFEVRLPLG